jgi:uncharacterized membrane protein
MTKLTLGVLIWSFTHLIPGLAAPFRQKMIDKFGENSWKGVFTLLMVLSLYLIISGWKAAIPEAVYLPPEWGRHVTYLLVLLGSIGFIATYPPNNLKRFLRHPQLTGVACWGIGHLMANGDSRSIILFGGLAAWAIIEILIINRREGMRQVPERVPLKNDVVLVAIALVIYAIIARFHQWLFGVSPFI